MEQAVSRRKMFKIIIAPTYDDGSRAKIAFWNDPQRKDLCETVIIVVDFKI